VLETELNCCNCGVIRGGLVGKGEGRECFLFEPSSRQSCEQLEELMSLFLEFNAVSLTPNGYMKLRHF